MTSYTRVDYLGMEANANDGAGFEAEWTSGIIAPGCSQTVSITFSPFNAIDYRGTITVNGEPPVVRIEC